MYQVSLITACLVGLLTIAGCKGNASSPPQAGRAPSIVESMSPERASPARLAYLDPAAVEAAAVYVQGVLCGVEKKTITDWLQRQPVKLREPRYAYEADFAEALAVTWPVLVFASDRATSQSIQKTCSTNLRTITSRTGGVRT